MRRLRSRLILFMILIAVPSVVLPAFVILSIFTTTVEDHVSRELENSGEHTIGIITVLLAERSSDLKAMTDPANPTLSSPSIPLESKVEFLRAIERSHKAYSSMSIYDLNGIKLGDTRSILVGLDESQKPFFQHTIKGEFYHDPAPVNSVSLGQKVIHFSAPIRNENSEITGVLVGRLLVTRINDIIGDELSIDNFGRDVPLDKGLSLVTQNGTIIYTNKATNEFTSLQIPALLGSRDAVKFSTIVWDPVDGRQEIIAVARQTPYLDYGSDNWMVVTEVDTKTAFAEIYSLQVLVTAIVLAIAGTASVLGILVARSISIPIEELKRATAQIAGGEYGKEIKVKADYAEISELSSNFEAMRCRISDMSNNLNSLVNVGTKDLRIANTELADQMKKLEESNEKLGQEDKMKNEFINVAAHELRTPMVPIILNAEDLAEDLPNDFRVKVILRNANRLTKLTNNILDVTRIRSKSLNLKMERLELNSLLQEITSNYQQILAEKNGPVLELNLEGKIYVNADKERINEVLTNFFDNAVKFTESGVIKISTQIQDESGQVTVSVRDAGKGIHPEIMDTLFTLFATKSFSGTGLGLFICRGIIEAHGGKIWGENNMDGTGATFAFSIPLLAVKQDVAGISLHSSVSQ